VPSRLADVHELEVIMTARDQAGRGVVELLPGEKIKHKDVYKLQRTIGRPFTWTALLTIKGYPWHEGMAELNQKERSTGADVWPQVSVRPLVFSMNMAEHVALTINLSVAQPARLDVQSRHLMDGIDDESIWL
jgi:hypothetical protein